MQKTHPTLPNTWRNSLAATTILGAREADVDIDYLRAFVELARQR